MFPERYEKQGERFSNTLNFFHQVAEKLGPQECLFLYHRRNAMARRIFFERDNLLSTIIQGAERWRTMHKPKRSGK